ncbi:ABC transporter ATP-binding protein [Streptomyces monomycini]|uniref:ABC transporter ATP-binding protein n=1 Tax=Streptomyces monomycini TaxID=371720 RepID=UPI000B2FC601|nr:ABC transporter ATP-binding protein [Streptomyces monomycini]
MARRPLPRILTDSAPIARGREFARTAADGAADVFHPLITISRGLRRLLAAGRRRWSATPKERRGSLLFVAAGSVLAVALVPYGPVLALVTVMAAAAWAGREQPAEEPAAGPGEAETGRLQALYEALVPYFAIEGDPSPLYAHDGDWESAFTEYAFDEAGRPARLTLRYPAYFTDGDAASRARIEQVLYAKSGRGREYRFAWDEESNQLTLAVLPPLPADIAAQRFVTTHGETVLGFTDPEAVQRTLPVEAGDETRDVPPVVWRTGLRSTEPHLLVLGQPGAGTTTLLRSIALQALPYGDVLVIDGGGTGEYACLAGRTGVMGVESGLSGALATLEWAAHETERRLITANRARQAGRQAPDDIRWPLWIILDRPSALAHLAVAEGRDDPQNLLHVPLRHGRAAYVTVVVADQLDSAGLLSEPVLTHTRARVVLGPATPEDVQAVLGAPPHTTPAADVPPGRGYARLGTGPVLRLQVPATPDPYDDATSEAHRQAVLDLLPEPAASVEEDATEDLSAAAGLARADAADGTDETVAGGVDSAVTGGMDNTVTGGTDGVVAGAEGGTVAGGAVGVDVLFGAVGPAAPAGSEAVTEPSGPAPAHRTVDAGRAEG